MMTFNKMEQLLYFSICFLSNVLIINYLPNVPKYTKTRQNDGSTPVILVLRTTIFNYFDMIRDLLIVSDEKYEIT